MTLIGWENIKYTKKGTNEEVNAVRLHCKEEPIRDNQCGEITSQIFVNRKYVEVPELKIGMSIDVMYDKYGNIKDIL